MKKIYTVRLSVARLYEGFEPIVLGTVEVEDEKHTLVSPDGKHRKEIKDLSHLDNIFYIATV